MSLFCFVTLRQQIILCPGDPYAGELIFLILCKRNLYLSPKVVVMQLGEKCVNMRVMRKRLFGKKQITTGYQSRAISKGTLLQSI